MTPRRIRITAGSVVAEAVLDDSVTAGLVWDALPLAVAGETWGDEIYFSIPVKAKPEKPRETVDMGDLGYWPPGSAFCIFFGPTPSSRGSEIRPASPVNVFGKIAGDPTVFKKVRSGTQVRVERALGPGLFTSVRHEAGGACRRGRRPRNRLRHPTRRESQPSGLRALEGAHYAGRAAAAPTPPARRHERRS